MMRCPIVNVYIELPGILVTLGGIARQAPGHGEGGQVTQALCVMARMLSFFWSTTELVPRHYQCAFVAWPRASRRLVHFRRDPGPSLKGRGRIAATHPCRCPARIYALLFTTTIPFRNSVLTQSLVITPVEKCLLQSESAQWPAPILSLIADSRSLLPVLLLALPRHSDEQNGARIAVSWTQVHFGGFAASETALTPRVLLPASL